MEASRPQPIELEGLSRFLVSHEACGAGFDVAHPAGVGSGRVAITCRGCGERHEYATATIEVEREVRLERVLAPSRTFAGAGHQPAPPPVEEEPTEVLPQEEPVRPPLAPAPPLAPRRRPPAQRPARPERGRRPAEGRRPGRRRGGHRLTLALIGISIAALAFAGWRLTSGGEDDPAVPVAGGPAQDAQPRDPDAGGPTPAETGGERAQQPSGAGRDSTGDAARPQGQDTAEPQGSAGGAREPAPPPTAGTVPVGTERYSIRVPRDWQRSSATGGGLRLEAPGGNVFLETYFERDPGLGFSEMAAATRRFLRQRNPGGEVSGLRRLERSGADGFRLFSRGPAEIVAALALLDGPYRYLLVRTEAEGSSRGDRRAARAAADTFRPR
jgi:hypothetical protein